MQVDLHEENLAGIYGMTSFEKPVLNPNANTELVLCFSEIRQTCGEIDNPGYKGSRNAAFVLLNP